MIVFIWHLKSINLIDNIFRATIISLINLDNLLILLMGGIVIWCLMTATYLVATHWISVRNWDINPSFNSRTFFRSVTLF